MTTTVRRFIIPVYKYNDGKEHSVTYLLEYDNDVLKVSMSSTIPFPDPDKRPHSFPYDVAVHAMLITVKKAFELNPFLPEEFFNTLLTNSLTVINRGYNKDA